MDSAQVEPSKEQRCPRSQLRFVAVRQDSVTDQLLDLVALANMHGMYDAADWLSAKLASISDS